MGVVPSTFSGTPATGGDTSYATLAELKGRLGVDTSDTADDATLTTLLERVSRAIDDHCRRRFYRDSMASARRFTTPRVDRVLIDDLVELTALETDPNADRSWADTWASADYELEPMNAAADGWPYEEIHVSPDGEYEFPTHRGGVRVTGLWGWPSVPGPVAEACLLQAARLWHRRDAPFGVVGASEMGQSIVIARLDPDVRMMLLRYIR